MSDTPSTILLTAAYDPTGAQSGPTVRLGKLELHDDRIEQIMGRLEDLEWMLHSGKDVRELRFNDRVFQFYQAPGSQLFPGGPEGDRLWQATELLLDQSAPWCELPPGKLPDDLPSAMDMLRKRPVEMVVGHPAGHPTVEWTIPYRASSTVVETPRFSQLDVLRWSLRAAPDRESFRHRFQRVVRQFPELALSVIQGDALAYDAGFPAPVQPQEIIEPDDLRPMLSVDDQEIREKTLSALACLHGQEAIDRSSGRRR